MKRITICFIGFVFLVIALGNPDYIFAVKEIQTMMCNKGVVRNGDTTTDVRDKCGEPNAETANEWIYAPGPSKTFKVIFKEGKVVRILESHDKRHQNSI